MKSPPSMTICIPVYKGSKTLHEALISVLHQKDVQYTVMITDDNHPEDTEEIEKTKQIIARCNDPRIQYFKSEKNQGYPKTMKYLVEHAQGDIVFLMAQDDILAKDALKKTREAFEINNDIGAVTRPYFWFERTHTHPVRAIMPLDELHPTVIRLQDQPMLLDVVIESIGQLSGLAMTRKLITSPVHPDHVFTCHVYPFLSIAKNHSIVYLNEMTVAVRIEESQSRHVSSIYDNSPTQEWMRLFDEVFDTKKYDELRKLGKKNMSRNTLGLIQLKNYASMKVFVKEIQLLIQYDKGNLLKLDFWFFSILTLVVPRSVLRRMTDWYKRHIHARTVQEVSFEPQT